MSFWKWIVEFFGLKKEPARSPMQELGDALKEMDDALNDAHMPVTEEWITRTYYAPRFHDDGSLAMIDRRGRVVGDTAPYDDGSCVVAATLTTRGQFRRLCDALDLEQRPTTNPPPEEGPRP